MLTRAIRTKLVVFGLIASVVLAIMAASYMQLPELMGLNRYGMTADFADTSGLYPGANVTLRGVDIGKVRAIELTASGSEVHFDINNGVHVPADSQIRIASTSAIGEQYLDIVPGSASGPFLSSGGVIARRYTIEMPQTAPMLDSVSTLLRSVPNQQLTEVLRNVTTAFQGSGPDMERLVSESSALVSTAQSELGPTTNLITTGGRFLATQRALAGQTTNYLEKLADLTDTLAATDPDLRALINNATPAASSVQDLVRSIQNRLPGLLDSTSAIGAVVATYLPALRQILVLLPAIVAGGQKGALVAPAGMTEIDFEENVGNPAPCLNGYLPSDQYQSPDSQQTVSTPAGLACKLPPQSQIAVRGASNLPCFGHDAVAARAPSVEACAGLPPSLLPSTNYSRSSLPVLEQPSTTPAGAQTAASAQVPWTTRTSTPTLQDLMVPSE